MTYNVSTGMLNTIIPMLIPHFATDIIHDAAMMRSLNMYCGPDGDLTSSKTPDFHFWKELPVLLGDRCPWVHNKNVVYFCFSNLFIPCY